MNKLLVVALLGLGLTLSEANELRSKCGVCVAPSDSSKGVCNTKCDKKCCADKKNCKSCKMCSHRWMKMRAIGPCRDASIRCASKCSHCNKAAMSCAIACIDLKDAMKKSCIKGKSSKKASKDNWKVLKARCLDACGECKKMCESEHEKDKSCNECAKACKELIKLLSKPVKAKSSKMQSVTVAKPAVKPIEVVESY